eukprot:m.527017 g.527017  ORF g.527017 m.527017 type:complete len:125 (-) comp22008_c0_seq4:1261-1635(-)
MFHGSFVDVLFCDVRRRRVRSNTFFACSYTAWIEFNGTANRGIWRPTSASNSPDILSMSAGNRHRFAFPDFLQEELYSHVGDDGTAHDAMDAYENKNLVGDPQHASMRQELFSLLDNRFNTPPV